MDTSKLKTYAPKPGGSSSPPSPVALPKFGITARVSPVREEGQLVIIEGEPCRRPSLPSRIKLVGSNRTAWLSSGLGGRGRTWFNRFAAIRFMELHGYLDHSFRVLSHPAGSALPEILEHA